MKTLEVLERVKRGKKLAKNTRENYDKALKSLAEYSDEWPTDAFVINEWLNSLSDKYADETLLLYYQNGKAAANYIQKAGGRDEYGRFKVINPFLDAERPKVEHSVRLYWNREQLGGIVKSCRGESDLCLIGVLMTSVCRIGELVELKFEDIYNDHFVCHGKIRSGSSSKTGSKTGERRYKLTYELAVRLRALAGKPGCYVFAKRDGSKIGVDGLAYRVRAIVKRSGLTGKKLGPHTIRHSMASLIAESTMSPLAVKAVLGHDDVNTSMRYIHDVEDKIAQKIDTVELSGYDVFAIKPDVRQLAIGEQVPDIVVVDEQGVEIDTQDLIEQMFEVVPDDVQIRPLLKARELLLLRSLMVDFSRVYVGDSRIYQSQALLKRMLRKAG